MTPEEDISIIMTKAPTDPKEKEKWVEDLLRVQIAMWVDGNAKCKKCGHLYTSVDDFISRDVRFAGKGPLFIDGLCYEKKER